MPIKLNIPPMAGACRKIQHASERAARDHLLHVAARNAVYGSGRPGLELRVYRCPECGFFHVGHGRPEGGAK